MSNKWIPIKEPGTNWLLFKYDPARMLIEIQRRGKKTLVDLSNIEDKPLADANKVLTPTKK